MAVKVGDVVTRGRDVPSGTLVKSSGGRFIWRRGDEGQIVKVPGGEPWGVDNMSWWQWYATIDRVTIIALDVPADATAEHLRELAEVFEVREALYVEAETCSYANVRIASHGLDVFVLHGTDLQAAAALLHRAGWRPSMTAGDAARLLAEVRDVEV